VEKEWKILDLLQFVVLKLGCLRPSGKIRWFFLIKWQFLSSFSQGIILIFLISGICAKMLSTFFLKIVKKFENN